MSSPGYKTLSGPARDEFTAQRSRFIGCASPVGSQEEAFAFIQRVREEHKDASHVCYAFIVGRNAGIMRYQDDGEPSGTAGQPIMEVLRQQGLVNCCCAVVRYFGGILLGAGGLARAYGKAASLAVAASGISLMEESLGLTVSLPYALWARLEHRLALLPLRIGEIQYAEQVTARLLVRLVDLEETIKAVTECSDGRAVIVPDDESVYCGWESA